MFTYFSDAKVRNNAHPIPFSRNRMSEKVLNRPYPMPEHPDNRGCGGVDYTTKPAGLAPAVIVPDALSAGSQICTTINVI